MLTKRAAAEQLRKYATVARFIRDQRELVKRAEQPTTVSQKRILNGDPNQVFHSTGTETNQTKAYWQERQDAWDQMRWTDWASIRRYLNSIPYTSQKKPPKK